MRISFIGTIQTPFKIELQTDHLLAARIARAIEMKQSRHLQRQEISNLRLVINLQPVIETCTCLSIVMNTIERIAKIKIRPILELADSEPLPLTSPRFISSVPIPPSKYRRPHFIASIIFIFITSSAFFIVVFTEFSCFFLSKNRVYQRKIAQNTLISGSFDFFCSQYHFIPISAVTVFLGIIIPESERVIPSLRPSRSPIISP